MLDYYTNRVNNDIAFKYIDPTGLPPLMLLKCEKPHLAVMMFLNFDRN